MGKKIFQNIITFVAIFLVIQLIFSFFNKKNDNGTVKAGEIGLETTEKEYGQGALVSVKIINKTNADIEIPNECPQEPLTVSTYENGQWIKKSASPKIQCENEKNAIIKSGEEIAISYENWNHALFGELGRYRIEGTFKIGSEQNIEQKTVISNEFEITEEGFFRFIWTRGFYQPIYNILMFFVSIMPDHSLGFAIILLTIFIRLILLIPSQKALKSQRRMQELQPHLSEIKEKHKGDQQTIAAETMKLWKENRVNPFGSCLPLLIQFPILIALFYVVQTGLNPDKEYLLYTGFVDISLTDINVMFSRFLDLTEREIFWLPLVVGILQFLQMKMAMVKKKEGEKKSETDMVNKTMLYFLPVMIAIFTASVPSGVGLYWLTSTLFGIVQQYFVNKGPHGNRPHPAPAH